MDTLNTFRVLRQLEQNLTGLQRDIRSNALEWRNAAENQTQNVGTIVQWINACCTAYNERLTWVLDLKNDPINWAKTMAMFIVLGGSEDEIMTNHSQLLSTVTNMTNAPKVTLVDIVFLCNSVIDATPAIISLWQENS